MASISRNSPAPQSVKVEPTFDFPAVVFFECILIVSVVILSLLLLAAILSRDRLRRSAFNQLVVSLAAGGIIFSLMLRPGTIMDEDKHTEMDKGYCSLYLMLQKVEWVFFPLTFWMMSIERLIALRQPESYAKKMTKVTRCLLIAVPWGFALAFSILVTFIIGYHVITRYGPYPDDPYFDEMSQFVQINCMMMYSQGAVYAARVLWIIFGCVLPVSALLITGITLIIVHFRRRGVKVYDDAGELLVSPGSVILCLLLSLSAVLIILDEQISDAVGRVHYPSFLYLHWAWSIVQLFLAFLAMFALPDVRRAVAEMCCCCDRSSQDENKALLSNNSKETQTPAPEPQQTQE